MARPYKQGVDYFPLDVYLDDKFKFIEIKYNLEGFAIVIKLLQKIYSCGYWYQWTDDEILLFADETRVKKELIIEIVDECLEREIFNRRLYDKYQILTSKGIQKRYKEIVRRRRDVEWRAEYLLIDNINEVNADIMPTPNQHNDNINEQSKQKVNRKETETDIKGNEGKDIIMTSTEAEYISVLARIKDYPLDEVKDIEYMRTLNERYPSLDMVQAINKFSDYILDKPFKKNANHRSQINTSFSKYVEWGACLKKTDNQEGRLGVPPCESVLGEREKPWM